MAASLETFKADAPPDQVAQALGETGGVIVEGLLPADSLRRLNEEVDAPLAAARVLRHGGHSHRCPVNEAGRLGTCLNFLGTWSEFR